MSSERQDALDELIQSILDKFAKELATQLMYNAKSCVTCTHFDGKNELCELASCHARPPANVIAFGCNSYLNQNEIPF